MPAKTVVTQLLAAGILFETIPKFLVWFLLITENQ